MAAATSGFVLPHEGIEAPFRVRMGINAGFCNGGNFGIQHRMRHTIIGAEANLAAPLQSIAELGQIVVNCVTYSAVRDLLSARPVAPIRTKGIGREITPYLVKGPLAPEAGAAEIFSEHWSGVDFFMDPTAVGAEAASRMPELLRRALYALGEAPKGEKAKG